MLQKYCIVQLQATLDMIKRRITEDAETRILKEATESSYRKDGANASISGDSISKEAVMNKLHRLEFPVLKANEKKEVKYNRPRELAAVVNSAFKQSPLF